MNKLLLAAVVAACAAVSAGTAAANHETCVYWAPDGEYVTTVVVPDFPPRGVCLPVKCHSPLLCPTVETAGG